MKNLERYLSEIKKQYPDVEQYLNSGAEERQLQELALKAGCELPADFVDLYSRFNGEDWEKSPMFMAGMQFLPLENVLSNMEFFHNAEDEFTAMGTSAIQEIPMCKLCWIPFAFDSSRAWLAIDLSPSESGKVGQIITVDYDVDECYLLADSMEDLFEKMTMWLQKGILVIHREEGEVPFIAEATGHLFNSLEELTMPDVNMPEQMLLLPEGFWQQYYRQKLVKNEQEETRVPISCLKNEKRMLIKEESIDCTPFKYMENLRELILHDCHLKNVSAIAKVPQLKKLIFARCTLDGEDLSALSNAPALKELSVNVMSGEGLLALQENNTLRSISLRSVKDFQVADLGAFTKLQELRLEDMDVYDSTFIGKLKNLKKLDLHRHTIDNLDFLKNLKKLTAFHLSKPAENEEGLSAVRELSKLKEFIYPVKDLSIYKGHLMLENVGMAKGVMKGFDVFSGSKVQGFTVCGKVSKEELEKIADKMEKYMKLYSYGSETV